MFRYKSMESKGSLTLGTSLKSATQKFFLTSTFLTLFLASNHMTYLLSPCCTQGPCRPQPEDLIPPWCVLWMPGTQAIFGPQTCPTNSEVSTSESLF